MHKLAISQRKIIEFIFSPKFPFLKIFLLPHCILFLPLEEFSLRSACVCKMFFSPAFPAIYFELGSQRSLALLPSRTSRNFACCTPSVNKQ